LFFSGSSMCYGPPIWRFVVAGQLAARAEHDLGIRPYPSVEVHLIIPLRSPWSPRAVAHLGLARNGASEDLMRSCHARSTAVSLPARGQHYSIPSPPNITSASTRVSHRCSHAIFITRSLFRLIGTATPPPRLATSASLMP
jgi:hypothetical protein